MRRAARTDANQSDAVKALRDAGISVKVVSETKKFCDLVCGFRGANILIELKDGKLPPSERKLTGPEQEFHDTWGGQIDVATSPEEAVMIVLTHAKKMGVL